MGCVLEFMLLGDQFGGLLGTTKGEAHVLNQPFQVGNTSFKGLDVAVENVSSGPIYLWCARDRFTHVLDVGFLGGGRSGRVG